MRFPWSGRQQRALRRGQKQFQRRSGFSVRRLHLEYLEPRQMLTVTLASLPGIQVPGGQPVLVPLTAVDSLGGPVTYDIQSSDPSAPVTWEILEPGTESLKLTVSGTDKDGNPFSGTLIFHLFPDLAPLATQRIEALVADSSNGLVGSDFFRVLAGFVAQTDTTATGSGFATEPAFDFVSPGLLSFAHSSAPNSNDASIFVTAIDGAGTTDPITLARMPQNLSGNFTVAGQLVSGFDIFEKIMSVVTVNQTVAGNVEPSSPVHTITITGAEIINDTQNAVLKITAPASFDNNGVTLTVTAKNTDGDTSDPQSFGVDVVVDPPTLGAVSNKTTTVNTPISFNLISRKNDTSVGVEYIVVDPTFGAPANVTVTIDQSTGLVTLTPDSGFLGTINLLAGVRADSAENDVHANFDTLPFTLTVTPNSALKPTLGAVSNYETTGTSPVTFTLTSSDPGLNGVAYTVVDAATFAAPTNATVSIVQATGEVTVTPNAGFTGVLNLLAGVRQAAAADVQANYDTKAFSITVNSDAVATPTLGPIENQTTPAGTAITFTLTSTDSIGDGVFYVVVDPTTFGAPANVTVSIVQETGAVTLTPAAGFTGTINLLAGVRSATADDEQANYNTEAFTFTVTPLIPDAPTALAVDASSNTGPFDGSGYITTNTPKLTVHAKSGATVKFKLNGTVIATATETSAGSGVYTATLPSGKLAVGANAITAIVTDTGGTSSDSAVLSLIYAPNYAGGVYVVPGTPGTTQQIAFAWVSKNAAYSNEFGYFLVDSADGSINGIAPAQAGYAQAALSSSSRTVVFAKGQRAGASNTITLQAGQMVVFYLIQNNTTANFLAKNPSNSSQGNNNSNAPLAFFSISAANPDGMQHTQIIADPTTGRVQYNWEDLLRLGDSDFNDAAIIVKLADQSTNPATPAVHVPGTGDKTIKVTGTLGSGKKSTAPGDIGVFFVDNPNGIVSGVSPGSASYTSVALATGNFQVLFASGASAGASQQITVPAGKYLAFYAITSGTTSNFLLINPTDSSSGGPVALFSFDVANPNGIEHFRWTSPENVQVDPSQTKLHIMDQIFGSDSDFDDLTVAISFSP